jgi:hypothetical protein
MKLRGKTHKGKNRIRELGSEWFLIRKSARVLFDSRSGSWWLIQPVGASEEKSRWIHSTADKDFEVVWNEPHVS